MYEAFRQIEGGEFVRVTSRCELEAAVQLVEALNGQWPGTYEVRDSDAQAVRYSLSCRSAGKSHRDLRISCISTLPERHEQQRN